MAAGLSKAQLALYRATLMAVLLSPGLAMAQSLDDPTRPPLPPAEQPSGARARAPQLQSVIITPDRRVAIIDGERVEQGGTYGDARVLRITETEVVLRSAGGTDVLKLYPNVEKAVRKAQPGRAASGSRERKSP